MRKAGALLAAVAMTAGLVSFAAEWEDPSVNSIGRLPPRTYAMPLASEAEALTDALEPETPYRMSLNGTWKFSWAGDPALRAKDFWRDGFDDSDWFDIEVPGCVELSGFGSPGYTNVRYPHANLSHPTNAAFAAIRDRKSGMADYNPVSSYRTRFTVPEAWRGRRVILRFDGVYSAYYVWVNGQRVGYAEDSALPSEFDITDFLRRGGRETGDGRRETGDGGRETGDGRRETGDGRRETGDGEGGENELAVEVYRWCDGSYLEDQDMTRFSGIFRDVSLWAMPQGGIWDFTVKTTPVEGYGQWDLEVEVTTWEKAKGENAEGESGAGEGGRAAVSLYDADGRKVGDLAPVSATTFRLRLEAPRLWSAEDPCLYTLVVKSAGRQAATSNAASDIRMKRIGFKEQKIVGNALLVNGRKVKFKGVNRHETNPERGRSVTLDDMVRDITLMKQYNIDTVRTSHYPDHHLWYDLCDRYGIYLVAEANVEGHEPGYRQNGLGAFPEWKHAIVERNERHVKTYRNHPSVTLWSMGNETGHGECFREAIAAVRAIDPSRPVHWERGNPDADVDSRMYPSVEWLDERGRLGDGLLGDARMEDEYLEPGNHQSANKPFFLCEYAHAMGNALGNFAEYWDVFYRYDSLCGGCIWDWIDQALWKPTGVRGKDGKPEGFLAYGGDFDEAPNDGPFNCNGVIGPERRVTAKLVEVGHVHRNLVVTRSEASGDNGFATVFELWNRFAFTRADAYLGTWRLLQDGKVVKRGAFEPPAVEPLSRCRFTVPGLAEALAKTRPRAELFVDFAFETRSDSRWAKKGWVVARDQVRIAGDWTGGAWRGGAGGDAGGAATVAEDAKTVTLKCRGTTATFSRETGTLCELTMAGRTVLKGAGAGPRLTCARAFTDNDVWLRQSFYDSGLTQLRYHARPIRVKGDRVTTVVEVTGSKSAGFTHEATWWLDGTDGTLCVSNAVTPRGTMPAALPRLGLSLRVSEDLNIAEWYGRGPRENYVDRNSGSFIGIWSSAADGLAEPYVRPQDNGYRGDVRWFSLTGGDDTGVRFSASEPMYVQAQRCGWEELEFARHRAGQQRFRAPVAEARETHLNLDVRQLGLGGGSCGPKPLEKYVFPVERTCWTLRMQPVR